MRESLKLAGSSPQSAGPGWRPVIPARLADAVIALGVAALTLASGLGGHSQGEQVPPGALPVLAMIGLVLYPRRRCRHCSPPPGPSSWA